MPDLLPGLRPLTDYARDRQSMSREQFLAAHHTPVLIVPMVAPLHDADRFGTQPSRPAVDRELELFEAAIPRTDESLGGHRDVLQRDLRRTLAVDGRRDLHRHARARRGDEEQRDASRIVDVAGRAGRHECGDGSPVRGALV